MSSILPRSSRITVANKAATEYYQEYVTYLQDTFPILNVEKMTKDIHEKLLNEGITNSLIEIDDYVKKERGEILLSCFPAEQEIFVYFSVRYERKNYDKDLYWKITTFIDSNQRHIAQDHHYYVDMPFMTANPSIHLSKMIDKIKTKIIEPLKPIITKTFECVQREKDMKNQFEGNLSYLRFKFPDLKFDESKNKILTTFHSTSCALAGVLHHDGSIQFTSLPTFLSKETAEKILDAVLNKF